ncbi:MAG: histidine phosphatase family protein [Pseudomonadota bacterium]
MRFLVLIAFLLVPTQVQANSLDLARKDGAILFMRHAIAPGGGDPDNFRLDDCSTQRNLSERGRQQARDTGAMLRKAGIIFDIVATSQWCRCRETAELMNVGEVVEWPSLNSFFGDRSKEPAQTAETLEKLNALPEGARVLLVTHQVNVTALSDVFPQSGEIIIMRRGDDGLDLAGMIAPR